ncbi:hypothetical protein B0H34DRAFT_99081 [Crassisporium funariophilum]|nr:hypothetical protein B0H34DRAFT_99081 [Crassisporium funariophilum]
MESKPVVGFWGMPQFNYTPTDTQIIMHLRLCMCGPASVDQRNPGTISPEEADESMNCVSSKMDILAQRQQHIISSHGSAEVGNDSPICSVPLGKLDASRVSSVASGTVSTISDLITSLSGPKIAFRLVNSIISAEVARSSKSPRYRTTERPKDACCMVVKSLSSGGSRSVGSLGESGRNQEGRWRAVFELHPSCNVKGPFTTAPPEPSRPPFPPIIADAKNLFEKA